MQTLEPSTREVKRLTQKQDLIFRTFSALVAKQEIGAMKASDTEHLVTIAEAVADRILKVRG